MYPWSAIFGTLISVECKLGTMFILPAPAHSLCFSCIVLVAFIFVLFGSMNTLLDGRPVSWKQSMSFSAPAPDVQPVSKMPVRFAIFCFHFSVILFFTFGLVLTDEINNRCLATVCSASSSSCSSTRQDSGDQYFLFLFAGIFTKISATQSLILLDVPGPCQANATPASFTDFQPVQRLLLLTLSSWQSDGL